MKWMTHIGFFLAGIVVTIFTPEVRERLFPYEPLKDYSIIKRVEVAVFGHNIDFTEVGIKSLNVGTVIEIELPRSKGSATASIDIELPGNSDINISAEDGYIVSYGWNNSVYKMLVKYIDSNSGTVILEFYKSIKNA